MLVMGKSNQRSAKLFKTRNACVGFRDHFRRVLQLDDTL